MDSFMLSANLAPNKTIILNLSFMNKLTQKSKMVKVLFDTGATNSGICRSILLDCGYKDFIKGTSIKQTALEERIFDVCVVEGFRLVKRTEYQQPYCVFVDDLFGLVFLR